MVNGKGGERKQAHIEVSFKVASLEELQELWWWHTLWPEFID